MNRESNEKVRIKVYLTEEENQKLEHDSALRECNKCELSALKISSNKNSGTGTVR